MEKRSVFSHSRPWTSEHIQAELAFRNAERKRRKLNRPEITRERALQHQLGIRTLHPDFEDTRAADELRKKIATQSNERVGNTNKEKKMPRDVAFAFQRVAEHMRNEYVESRGENDDSDGDNDTDDNGGPSGLRKAHNNRAERLEHLLQGIQELGIRGEALEPNIGFIEYEYSLAFRDAELKHGFSGQAEAERYLADMTTVRDAVYKARFEQD